MKLQQKTHEKQIKQIISHLQPNHITNNTTNNTTNNSIYVGSTRDLQDIINSARSTQKVFVDEDQTKSV